MPDLRPATGYVLAFEMLFGQVNLCLLLKLYVRQLFDAPHLLPLALQGCRRQGKAEKAIARVKVGTTQPQLLFCRLGLHCSGAKQVAPADKMPAALTRSRLPLLSAGKHAGSIARQDDCSGVHSCSRAPAAACGQYHAVASDSTCQHAENECHGGPGLAAQAQHGEPLLC